MKPGKHPKLFKWKSCLVHTGDSITVRKMLSLQFHFILATAKPEIHLTWSQSKDHFSSLWGRTLTKARILLLLLTIIRFSGQSRLSIFLRCLVLPLSIFVPICFNSTSQFFLPEKHNNLLCLLESKRAALWVKLSVSSLWMSNLAVWQYFIVLSYDSVIIRPFLRNCSDSWIIELSTLQLVLLMFMAVTWPREKSLNSF